MTTVESGLSGKSLKNCYTIINIITEKWHIQRENTQRQEEISEGHIIRQRFQRLVNARTVVRLFSITVFVRNADTTGVSLLSKRKQQHNIYYLTLAP